MAIDLQSDADTKPGRHPVLTLLGAMVLGLGACFVGLSSDLRPPTSFHIDKAAHCIGFIILTGMALRLLPRLLVVGFVSSLAILIEVIQLSIPGRMGDPWDALASLVGVGVVMVLTRRKASQTSTALQEEGGSA
ncbi:MAG: hypothetical protein ACPGOY_15105 [Rhodospirillaceae bacterium]